MIQLFHFYSNSFSGFQGTRKPGGGWRRGHLQAILRTTLNPFWLSGLCWVWPFSSPLVVFFSQSSFTLRGRVSFGCPLSIKYVCIYLNPNCGQGSKFFSWNSWAHESWRISRHLLTWFQAFCYSLRVSWKRFGKGASNSTICYSRFKSQVQLSLNTYSPRNWSFSWLLESLESYLWPVLRKPCILHENWFNLIFPTLRFLLSYISLYCS